MNILIDNSYYKKNKLIKILLINFIELFFLKEYKLSKANDAILIFYHNFIKKIYNNDKFNLDDESSFFRI